MTYEFTLDIVVDGKSYRQGDTVGGEDVPNGSLMSLLRLRQLVPVKVTPLDIQELATPASNEQASEPTPKKSRK